MMIHFTQDEMTLMSIYNDTGTRQGLLAAITAMRGELAEDETELRDMTDSAIRKLNEASDAEYAALDLYPDFGGMEGDDAE